MVSPKATASPSEMLTDPRTYRASRTVSAADQSGRSNPIPSRVK